MKNILRNTWLVLLIVVSYHPLAHTQNYIKMTDASGINTDAYQAALQKAADSLVAVFPKEFKSDFKVYDFGFYLHDESYSGGYPEAFAQAIADVSAKSPYYLLFGKQTDHSGVYTKFWVDLKLPTSWLAECFDDAYIKVVKASIKTKIKDLKVLHSEVNEFAVVEIEGMRLLRNKIGCCQPEEAENACSGCITIEDVFYELLNEEFLPISSCNIMNKDTSIDNYCLCLPGLAAKLSNNDIEDDEMLINESDLEINIDGEVIDFAADISGDVEQGTLTIVSDNKTFCNQQLYSNLLGLYETSDDATWIHIWQNDEDGTDVVFVKRKNSEIVGLDVNTSISFPEVQSAGQPDFIYTVYQRTFAPWDRFGHFPLLPHYHVAKNSFHGDNRGFSLKDSRVPLHGNETTVTARLHQYVQFDLRGNKIDEDGFCSETRGYYNFVKKIPATDYFPEEILEEQSQIQVPNWVSNLGVINNGGAEVNMSIEGADPLVRLLVGKIFQYDPTTPDIEDQLHLKCVYSSVDSNLYIFGAVLNKEFPAYEAFIEDNCGHRFFLLTQQSPCESSLASELMRPVFDYAKKFGFRLKVDNDGCFGSTLVELGYTDNGGYYDILKFPINVWNLMESSSAPALDCPSTPCEGAYGNEGEDRRLFFNCGW